MIFYMIRLRGEYTKVISVVVILVSIFVVYNGSWGDVEELGYDFSCNTKAISACDEGVIWFFSVEPEVPAGEVTEGVEVFSNLATMFGYGFTAVFAGGLNMAGGCFSGINSGGMQGFPDSHTGYVVFGCELDHGNEIDLIGVDDGDFGCGRNFHKAPFCDIHKYTLLKRNMQEKSVVYNAL